MEETLQILLKETAQHIKDKSSLYVSKEEYLQGLKEIWNQFGQELGGIKSSIVATIPPLPDVKPVTYNVVPTPEVTINNDIQTPIVNITNDVSPTPIVMDMSEVSRSIVQLQSSMEQLGEMVSQLIRVLVDQPSPSFSPQFIPQIKVDVPPSKVDITLPSRGKRRLKITHSDGTTSTAVEE